MSTRTCDDCAWFSRKDGMCIKRLKDELLPYRKSPHDEICDDFYLDPFIQDLEVSEAEAFKKSER